MSLTSYLQFGNNELGKYSHQYLLRDVKCLLRRQHDGFSPCKDPLCDNIEVFVYQSDPQDLTLIEWFIEGSPQNGRLLMEETDAYNDNESQWNEIRFEDAICYSLKETFKLDEQRRVVHLSFVAGKVEYSKAIFTR